MGMVLGHTAAAAAAAGRDYPPCRPILHWQGAHHLLVHPLMMGMSGMVLVAGSHRRRGRQALLLADTLLVEHKLAAATCCLHMQQQRLELMRVCKHTYVCQLTLATCGLHTSWQHKSPRN
jgi:hypothetical protein